MDPIAHTLVGAALAQTGLGRRTAYGAATLVIGANLPDIDILAIPFGEDTALLFRRGWTHGVLALVILPILLTGLIAIYQRVVSRGSNKNGPPFKFGVTLGLSYLAVTTHPSLDWLNNYGMRWLMPFEGRWFYGDSVFIIDPWMWFVLGGGVFLFHSRRWWSVTGWGLFAAAIGALLFTLVPELIWAKLLWAVLTVSIAVARIRGVGFQEAQARPIAIGALCLTIIYIGGMIASARFARQAVAEALVREGLEVERLMVGPVPVTPFVRDVVVQTPESYRYGKVRLLPQLDLELEPRSIPLLPDTALVKAATESDAVRGFMNWVRFPSAEVEESDREYEVYLLDVRYLRSSVRGFGSTLVTIPRTALDE